MKGKRGNFGEEGRKEGRRKGEREIVSAITEGEQRRREGTARTTTRAMSVLFFFFFFPLFVSLVLKLGRGTEGGRGRKREAAFDLCGMSGPRSSVGFCCVTFSTAMPRQQSITFRKSMGDARAIGNL